MLCALGERLIRAGHEPRARCLWSQARAAIPDDVWIYVQAGIGYSDLGDHPTALAWLTPGMELALRTGDPESALEQLVALRATSLAATGDTPDDLQARAHRALACMTGDPRASDETLVRFWPDGPQPQPPVALAVFWSRSEHRAMITRWPRLTAVLGATWDECRQRTERYCVLVDNNGFRARHLPGNAGEFEAFSLPGVSPNRPRRTCSPIRTCVPSTSQP